MKRAYYSARRRAAMRRGDDIVHLEVFERDGWICNICDQPIDPRLRGDNWWRATLDHIIPLCKNGTHTYDNTAASHWLCNNAKGARIIGMDVTREEIIAEVYCEVADCYKPRHQGQKMCGSHYMKKYRYGDPLYKAPRKYIDLTGQKFGLLTVTGRDGIKWECLCECGSYTAVRPGDLNNGNVKSCGNVKLHRRSLKINYHSMHARVNVDRGKASQHKCTNCGAQAKHWAYNHSDPEELQGSNGPYSMDVNMYDPMCVSCHKIYDLDLIKLGLDR